MTLIESSEICIVFNSSLTNAFLMGENSQIRREDGVGDSESIGIIVQAYSTEQL